MRGTGHWTQLTASRLNPELARGAIREVWEARRGIESADSLRVKEKHSFSVLLCLNWKKSCVGFYLYVKCFICILDIYDP